ncbi:hypothetical protein N8005_04705 [Litorivicinus sp.]|nr:hypothetical protein [Litorivicinus sp.]MDC1467069.1 hypothetical protein [Litorivicinus sp.]
MNSEFRWIIISTATAIAFGAGLLIYGILDSNSSRPNKVPSANSTSAEVVKIDSWKCVQGTDARGSMYEYSKNQRNGASGPASRACKRE